MEPNNSPASQRLAKTPIPPGGPASGAVVRIPQTGPPSETFARASIGGPPSGALPVSELSGQRIEPSMQRIGDYEVVEELSSGGFGRVFKCADHELDMYVAVKVARDEIVTADKREEFLQHANWASSVQHVCLCPIYKVGVEDGRPYVVMPFFEGGSLAQWKRQNRLPPITDALDRLLGLVRALAVLHDAGFVHYALKPTNILVDGSRFVITDHAWASLAGDPATAHSRGTNRYMAPEQWRSGSPHLTGPRSDIFSLGVMLFELLTNSHPYPWLTEDVLAQGVAAWTHKPRAPSEVLYGLDRRLDTLCLGALSIVPGDRYASAQAFAHELEECRAQVAAGLLITAEEDFKRGEQYYYGCPGTPRDPKRARKLFERAAAQGYAPAQNSLGTMYQHALGVPRDYVRACELYQKAADQGDARAQNNLGYMYLKGFGVEKDYGMAYKLYAKAAKQGDAAGQYNLGSIYLHALGVPLNYEKARLLYEKAAEQGFAKAQNGLGFMYLEGLGVEKDYVTARVYFAQAARQGFGMAQNCLAFTYLKGLGVEKDYNKARILFEKAVLQGIPQAYNGLGYMYQYGLAVDQDFAKARELFLKAAKKGLAEAHFNLGYMYEHGLGVKKDLIKARALYLKATTHGDEDAQKALERMMKRQ